ncbi:hypothetical protein ANN_03040 [Periplaneta americana]|uniref:Tc1-like transposase DDE domain-containing protein n=1 Tax=Periplaneta americana TaxID=6978 RepID=A0ABQ8TXX6_PERAM|nr:hypothetical protein ANN_03040 [Periplaneta americana]
MMVGTGLILLRIGTVAGLCEGSSESPGALKAVLLIRHRPILHRHRSLATSEQMYYVGGALLMRGHGRPWELNLSSGRRSPFMMDIHWNVSPFLLQHGTQLDNGSWPHVSEVNMQWYADNNVHRLDWPAQSPDLNPIEHLWDKLDRRLRFREMRPTSIVQLSSILQEEWRRISVISYTN